jgi:4-diphosphocytidyl-2-C-methyl-D-erythritol kinase
MRMQARAKVNLALRVHGVRPDGYHEVETLLQSITLHDEISMEPAETTRVSLEWAPGLAGTLPERPDIVERTIRTARRYVADLPNATVRIVKGIPIGAGLGGASADAAAVILGLVALHGRNLPTGLTRDIASEVGVDVPFCLIGGTARGTGAGNQLEPLPNPGTLWWVLGIPSTPLSTGAVYRRFDEVAIPTVGNIEELIAALSAGDLEGIGATLVNDLEPAAFELLPKLAGLKRAMRSAGAIGSVMTGSGSAIIGLCRDPSHARAVAQRARQAFPRVEIASSAATGTDMLASHGSPRGDWSTGLRGN